MGLYTFSLLDRSSDTPMGTESSMDSVVGSVGRLVSSANSVMVKTPVIESAGMLVVRGAFDRDNSPMSDEAVDATMRRS